MHNIFEHRKSNNIPVWFMRQAGRYHSHYQGIKKKHTFMEMCKKPELACEVTLGPIMDFKFDAAILFSDILFPLEQLNMGLNYDEGKPSLTWLLENKSDLNRLKTLVPAKDFYKFQQEALRMLVNQLPQDVTLLGFVGAPFTLYTYAVEGGHSGSLVSSKKGLYDGRFEGFMEKLYPELLENMKMQAMAGADCMCLFDTAAGELSLIDYKKFIVPVLQKLTKDFKKSCPDTKITYYSKMTNLSYLSELENPNIDVLGIDWRVSLSKAIRLFSKEYFIQGNFDPSWLHLEWNDLEANLKTFYQTLTDDHCDLKKWICGLGHGVLIKTPEENVRKTVRFIHDNFRS